MALRIEDYALIGDCESAALVGRDGSIDWLCWPRFDSDACFAALLGTRENGRFCLCPSETPTRVTRGYRPRTLILETQFELPDGVVTVIDFMPMSGRDTDIVRLVRGDRGRVNMCADLVLRFGYGSIVPWVVRLDEQTLRAIAGPDMVTLRTPVALHGEDLTTVGEFTIHAGETIPFVLTYAPSHEEPPPPLDVNAALRETEDYWRLWTGRCKAQGPYCEMVVRSLITLKALTHRVNGGIVAAPTTSLPEEIGGVRNWDYRFCWVRDATLTLLALLDAGYLDEASAWRDWLIRAVAGSPNQIQVMYGVAGERRLTEWEVPWLRGYENSRPVRVGNGAFGQLQLDIYGELADALHQARVAGLPDAQTGWGLQRALLAHLERIWREPDEGIWEVRGPRQHFTFSKIMVWVAFDRALKDVELFGLEGPVERWRAIKDEVHEEVLARGYDDDRQTFVQAYGSANLDASLLLIPQLGFLPPDDQRVIGTITAIERGLMQNGFVRRYDTGEVDDGLPGREGTFLACSFWLVDAYILLGRHDQATALFERLIHCCNDVGLLSEEYDPGAKRALGNFPQAFSHVGLVNSAFNLTQRVKPAKQRSRDEVAEELAQLK